MLAIGVCFLSASVLFSATCNEPEEFAACVSLKMARFTLYLSGVLFSLPSKLHSICREEFGQGIELSAL